MTIHGAREVLEPVAAAVAAILDAPVREVPPELLDVVRIRSATRRVLEAHPPVADERRLLDALAKQAARTSLPVFALAAMEAELVEPEAPELLPIGEAARARMLHRQGFAACPVCLRPVLAALTLDLDDQRRRRVAYEREVHLHAVPGGLVG
jgi:hypothetical protein